MFTDASEAGFGACVYINAKYGKENFSLNQILTKARVAPLRQLSIPRLKLQGSVLGAILCATVVKELGAIASNVIYWCDSQTVLQWIHSTKCKYHAFVAHWITEIADTCKASQWRHVPGNLNPADDCSRGIPATHLTSQHRWLRGPDFLLMSESAWPSPININEPSPDDVELVPEKYICVFRVHQPHPIYTLIQNSSNIITVKRIVAWLLRFVTNFNLSVRHLPRVGPSWLIPVEIRDAANLIMKVYQAHHFQMELNYIRQGKPVPVTSKLACLSPSLDTNGILHVGGRLQHAFLPEYAKHPAILDPSSQLSTMIIWEIHERLAHASTELTLHDLRQQYHVLRPRASIRLVIRNCSKCKLRNSKPDSPLMGPLPASRLQSHLPWIFQCRNWLFRTILSDHLSPEGQAVRCYIHLPRLSRSSLRCHPLDGLGFIHDGFHPVCRSAWSTTDLLQWQRYQFSRWRTGDCRSNVVLESGNTGQQDGQPKYRMAF